MPEPDDAPILSMEAQQILAKAWQRSIPIPPSDDDALLLYLLGALPEADSGELEESLTYHATARQKLREIASSLDDWQHRTLDNLVLEAVTNHLIRRYLQHLLGQLLREADANVQNWVQSLRKSIWQEVAPSSNIALARSDVSEASRPDASGRWSAPLRLLDGTLRTIELGPLTVRDKDFTIEIASPASLSQATSGYQYDLFVELAVTPASCQTLAMIRGDDITKTITVPLPQLETTIDPHRLAALLIVSLRVKEAS